LGKGTTLVVPQWQDKEWGFSPEVSPRIGTAVESRIAHMAKSATASQTSLDRMGSSINGTFDRVKSFYTDVRTEMKKVTSPSRKEVQGTTIVVIITVFLFGAYFGVIDFVISNGINKVLHYFGGK
jgi:preprotein translocase subunit SecE